MKKIFLKILTIILMFSGLQVNQIKANSKEDSTVNQIKDDVKDDAQKNVTIAGAVTVSVVGAALIVLAIVKLVNSNTKANFTNSAKKFLDQQQFVNLPMNQKAELIDNIGNLVYNNISASDIRLLRKYQKNNMVEEYSNQLKVMLNNINNGMAKDPFFATEKVRLTNLESVFEAIIKEVKTPQGFNKSVFILENKSILPGRVIETTHGAIYVSPEERTSSFGELGRIGSEQSITRKSVFDPETSYIPKSSISSSGSFGESRFLEQQTGRAPVFKPEYRPEFKPIETVKSGSPMR